MEELKEKSALVRSVLIRKSNVLVKSVLRKRRSALKRKRNVLENNALTRKNALEKNALKKRKNVLIRKKSALIRRKNVKRNALKRKNVQAKDADNEQQLINTLYLFEIIFESCNVNNIYVIKTINSFTINKYYYQSLL